MILRDIKNSIKSIGKSVKSPIFIKEYNEENKIIIELEKLKEQITDEEELKKIDRDIRCVNVGMIGEKNVYYELKNSFLPIVCLHDLYIKHEDYEAQIDFLIITSKFICILETKKLSGDIEVNNNGDFIRAIKNFKGKTFKKEGMYSPITQNERHVKIIKDLLIKNKMIKHCPVISRVIMANPKSIVNTRYAPKYIKDQLIKFDQISENLRMLIEKASEVDMPYESIIEIAEFFKNNNIEKSEHYIVDKYKDVINKGTELKKEVVENEAQVAQTDQKEKIQGNKKDKLYEDLKKYRLKKSREEEVKAYFIFNNKQLDDLIDKLPKNKDELIKISGFGAVKVEKYGQDIIEMILKY